MTERSTIVWFRRDLRLADNEALSAAIRRGGSIIPLFIHSPEEEGEWALGGASRYWLHHSLEALTLALKGCGSELIIRQGKSQEVLSQILKETGGGALYWNRVYDPLLIARDAEIKQYFKSLGIVVESFNSALLCEPWEIKNSTGKGYEVFTPFWRQLQKSYNHHSPLPAPEQIPGPSVMPRGELLNQLKLLPKLDWAQGIGERWTISESGAANELRLFLSTTINIYKERRDFPADTGTSRLSPYLHFGEIGPRQIWDAVVRSLSEKKGTFPEAAEGFLRQIAWREFAHHLLYHFPNTPTEPLRTKFAKFPWRKRKSALKSWQRGLTGYPIVDAGMRELWQTGWMHNRVRMIVGSFLVKDLLIPWQEGARWFWDTLVDANLANNTLGWQWIAGCGADAAPYFRIFNPVKQGEKFDPKGVYIRRYIPELADMPDSWIHKPWLAPAEVLHGAGVILGSTYPQPIVDHGEARDLALQALADMKEIHPNS